MDEKTNGQLIQEKLAYKSKNAWEKTSPQEIEKVFEFCEGYKEFLDMGKTERECTKISVELAKSKGFQDIDQLMSNGSKITPGMKVYKVVHEKSIMLAVIGTHPLDKGINIIGGHIDAPRIDLKPNPLYEDTGMALFKTHYYGGIKKYQWVSIPLALHGVIVKTDGEVVNVCIGEDSRDPVFTITDLLPHLAQDQMSKKMSEAITGEGLNLLIGSIPYNDEKVKESVKLNILNILNEKYGIIEEDFISAELEIVPAFKSKDVGFDRGMIGAYGQDDRVCSYISLRAILDMEAPEKTAMCILTDKEEIGSMGNTGAESTMLINFISFLMEMLDNNFSENKLRKALENSYMLSADVNPAVDPTYDSVHEKKNSTFLGNGILFQKYTGVRGKVGGSDANAEFIAKLRKLFNENGIIWQTGELGKVDQGGGGTIAQYVANLGVEVVDCGVPILSMHSPFEITSKIDVFICYNAFKAFYDKFNQ
jgi:aspartyl aminopeptidase